ncbi:S4 domain-containing protein [Kiritimatiellaeota bacterium B1221]|nr:S4 domain-containing protein [Kiritimatiellaeota bacterium B1221]
MAESVRLDKWLWAARFYKTRPLAQKAIEGGKVRAEGARAKAGKKLQVGQALEIRVGMELYQITVVALSEKRGPASQARTLYEESSESVKAREQASVERKAAAAAEPRFDRGRPDKKQRRMIQKMKRNSGF